MSNKKRKNEINKIIVLVELLLENLKEYSRKLKKEKEDWQLNSSLMPISAQINRLRLTIYKYLTKIIN